MGARIMDISTCKEVTPIEIMDYLCNYSANGYQKDEVIQLEGQLGFVLPIVLRQFLLKAGKECICVGEKKIFSLSDFKKQEEYLIIKVAKQGKLGILLNNISEGNPTLYIQNKQGEWNMFAENIESYLMIELDRRIRKAGESDDTENPMRRYWYTDCPCKELTTYMQPSEIYIFQEEPNLEEEEGPLEEVLEDLDSDWDEDEDWDEEDLDSEWDKGDTDWDWNEEDKEFLVGDLKNFLFARKVSLLQAPYSISICWDEETSSLYSAHFPRDGQGFISLLQIKVDRTVYYIEQFLFVLAEGVHNPVIAHCLTKEAALPETVRRLADEELHTWLAETIGDFLELFEKNNSWKIGIYVSGKFIECSKSKDIEEPLSICWFSRHLKAEPSAWEPSFTRAVRKKQEAPKNLEPFLKELIYRVHDYNLLNRYAFLAKKVVTDGRFSNLTKNYTEEERYALLSFYRKIADNIMECIFYCLEKKIFAIRINGKDFLELCNDPLVHLEGWIYQYERESLAFLDKGSWPI